jgi:FkbM family methyltransferase
MLIPFNIITNKYGKPKGIIHIGAHLLEERNDYLSQGIENIVWIEANPKIFTNIKNLESTKELFFNYAISNLDEKQVKFNITNNGQSSSILDLEKHKIHHPHIFVSSVIEVESKRMDTLIVEENLDLNKYDFLNIDIQGAELLALKGFGNLLENINFIYLEVNTNSLYKNCALINEIDDYLSQFNFIRVETKITEYEWGDALYIKK